jgi:hypothetical protein
MKNFKFFLYGEILDSMDLRVSFWKLFLKWEKKLAKIQGMSTLSNFFLFKKNHKSDARSGAVSL